MRLIDADKIGLTDFEIVMCKGDYKKALTMLLDKIENQQTVYDVDKIVEQLEEEKHVVFLQDEELKIRVEALDDAIEIVNQGGVYDDVCEWEYNDTEYYWESSCEHLHIFMSDGPKENEYDFCPYCGKKIKVVE